MASFRPTVPLLVSEAAMSKAVVQTGPDTFALNTVDGSSVPSAWTPADVTEIIGNTVYDDGGLNQYTVAESAHQSANSLANIDATSTNIASDVDHIKSSATDMNISLSGIDGKLDTTVPDLFSLGGRIALIQEATGSAADSSSTNSIIGLLKSIVNKLS